MSKVQLPQRWLAVVVLAGALPQSVLPTNLPRALTSCTRSSRSTGSAQLVGSWPSSGAIPEHEARYREDLGFSSSKP